MLFFYYTFLDRIPFHEIHPFKAFLFKHHDSFDHLVCVSDGPTLFPAEVTRGSNSLFELMDLIKPKLRGRLYLWLDEGIS